jgi:DNA-binding NarL/FixJ family response regulator
MGSKASIRVVLVEDHDLFRNGLRDLLRERGIEVVGEAADGVEAIGLVAATAPDVAVMDVGLPGKSGIEATRVIRRRSPATQVLMLSVHEDEEDIVEAIIAGACGYLSKDSPIDEITESVRAVARGEATLSARIAAKLVEQVRGNGSLDELPAGARPQLTEREHQALCLIAAGKDNPSIAAELQISLPTVKNHVSSVLTKLEVDNRIQAAVYAVRRGMV